MPGKSVRRARELRKAMSPPELALWLQLRALRNEGWHFRRQSPEGPYFLDFVCRSAKLVVEVDGIHHASADQAAHDKARDAYLRERGFHVLRVSAVDVGHELDGVMQGIRAELNADERTVVLEPPAAKGGPRYRHVTRLGLQRRPNKT